MAGFFFSEARAGLILINWKNDMAELFSFETQADLIQEIISNDHFLFNILSEVQGQANQLKREPEMDPKMTPKMIQIWIHFGSPKSTKTIVIPCVFTWNGAPVFDPKMDSEMSQNLVQILTKFNPNCQPRGPDLIKKIMM